MRLPFPVVVLLFASSAWTQTVPNPFYLYQPFGQLRVFLQLSDSQLQSILANNDEYNHWSYEKQARIRQIQAEIADETGKEPLDPSALGVRYAEIETICREMKDRAKEYRTRNTDVLNPEQKTRLQVLEDAIKLAPVISEAQSGNLAGGLTSAPYGFTGASVGAGGSAAGGVIGSVSGCSFPFHTAWARGGDFDSARTNGNAVPGPRAGNPAPTRWFDVTPGTGNRK